MAGFFLARLPSYPRLDDGVSKTALPAVATAASWMETTKMPLRKVYETYTRSELSLQAWRSGEIAHNMHLQYQERANERSYDVAGAFKRVSTEEESALESRLGENLVKKLDEDLDFRKLTGDEVMRFMGAMGIHIGGRVVIPANIPTMEEATRGLRRR